MKSDIQGFGHSPAATVEGKAKAATTRNGAGWTVGRCGDPLAGASGRVSLGDVAL